MLLPLAAALLAALCQVTTAQDFDIQYTDVLDTLELGSRSAEAVAAFNFSDPAVIEQALGEWQATAKYASKPETACPVACSEAGNDPSNWALFSDVSGVASCNETVLLDFAVLTNADGQQAANAIRACTADSTSPSHSVKRTGTVLCIPALEVNITVSVQMASSGSAQTRSSFSQEALARGGHHIANYLGRVESACDKAAISFSSAGNAVLGAYGGYQAHRQGVSVQLLDKVISHIEANGVSETLVVELCERDINRGSDYIVGIVASTQQNGLSFVQDAVRQWSNGSCIISNSSASSAWAQVSLGVPVPVDNSSSSSQSVTHSNSSSVSIQATQKRADACKYITVVSGDGCASLASKCGISGSDFTKYNSATNFCATLKPGQPVCCSSGQLPDLTPKPNADGSCAVYTTQSGDTCADIAARNMLTAQKLEELNGKTWGWNGCDLLWAGVSMCLSTGGPPMPATVTVSHTA